MPELKVVAGSGAPRTIRLPLGEEEWVLGTGPSCQVVLEDEEVRDRHARIRRSGVGYVLEPLERQAELELNGHSAESPVPLQAEDEIRVGGTLLVWSPGDDIEAVSMGITVEEAMTNSGVFQIPKGLVPARPYVGDELTAGTGATFQVAPEEVVTGDRLMDAITQVLGTLRSGYGVPEASLASLAMAFGGDRALLYLPFGTDRPRLVASFLGPAELSAEEGLTPALIEAAAGAGVPILVNAGTATVQVSEMAMVGGVVRSLMAVPVPMALGEGTLVVDAPAERRRFQEQDVAVLSSFASTLGWLLATSNRIRRMEEVIETWSQSQKRGVEALRRSMGGETRPRLQEAMEQAAPGDGPVLLFGETGVGKRAAALRLHLLSGRGAEPVQVVDCAREESLGRALFGFAPEEEGSPIESGALELARRGTVVVHHATALTIGLQARIEEYLASGNYQTEGRRVTRSSDARIFLTLDRDPSGAGGSGWFLASLLDRFSVRRKVEVPPLRSSPDYLEGLARTVLSEYAVRLKKPVTEFTPEALKAILAHPWPGNHGELRFVLESAVRREPDRRLSLASLKPFLCG